MRADLGPPSAGIKRLLIVERPIKSADELLREIYAPGFQGEGLETTWKLRGSFDRGRD